MHEKWSARAGAGALFDHVEKLRGAAGDKALSKTALQSLRPCGLRGRREHIVACRLTAQANCGSLNDAFRPKHQRLQQPALQINQTSPVDAIAAPFTDFSLDLFARDGLGGLGQQGLQVQINENVDALLRILLLLQKLGAWLLPCSPAVIPQRNVQSKQ